MSENYVLEMKDITKRFPGVLALDKVRLSVRKGTVHALMGENGAGKSTLMKVLLGLYKADAGTIVFKGQEVSFSGPSDALKHGIAMIHQELANMPERTVAENMFLGREMTGKGRIFIRERTMEKESLKIFRKLNIEIDPKAKMKELTVAQQQLCEIAKAVSCDADLIIMDEPTSSIMEDDAENLFRIIRELLEKEITVIYISHKMDEIFKISDDITVFRDGTYVDTKRAESLNQNTLISMMVGREITDFYQKKEVQIGETVLKVEGLSSGKIFRDISFELRRGEILGFAGLVGAGRTEIMETIFGIRKKTKGDIFVHGRQAIIHSPKDAIRHNIGFLTEDRKASGCFLSLSVNRNTYIASIDKYSRLGIVSRKKTSRAAEEMRKTLSIKIPGIEQLMENLSGGNQQKVLIGRWLLIEPQILIVDEPTRGIDVGSKTVIHRLLSELAAKGTSIILISSEMPEVIGMSDRIIVLHEGEMTGILEKKEFDQERIMALSSGISSTEEDRYVK
jgi:inositol transport system ATP-binding protein